MKYLIISIISLSWITTEAGGLVFNLDGSTSDIHVTTSRLFSITTNSRGSCSVACFEDADCVSFGYASSGTNCQGYRVDVGGFIRNYINQHATQIFKAVCEMPDFTYIRSLNLCLKRVASATTWSVAMDTCNLQGATLMDLTTTARLDYLKDTLPNMSPAVDYWVGGSFTGGQWAWQTGEEFNDSSEAWPYWIPGYPDSGECMSFVSFGEDLGVKSEDCTLTKSFICAM